MYQMSSAFNPLMHRSGQKFFFPSKYSSSGMRSGNSSLLSFFSRQQFFRCLHLSPILSAPKPKKGAAAAGKGSSTPEKSKNDGRDEQIFNIYEGLEDHKIQSDDYYPKWVHTLHIPKKTYGELATIFLYGKGIEKATLDDYIRFSRLHTKTLIKLNNMRLKKSKRASIKTLYWDI